MEVPRRGSKAGTHLDAIRGTSAIIVMLSHLRALTLVDFEEVHRRSILMRVFYLVSGLGHEAVVIFFVLSGYFISASVLRALRSDRWDVGRYALARLSRLYVVLIPALVLGLALDRLGLSRFPGYLNYTGGYSHMVPGNIPANLDLRTAAINIGFLETIHGPVWGSNSALWSLACEFWYYVAFPLLALTFWKGAVARRLACFFGLGLVLLFIEVRAPGFGIWLLGTMVFLLPPKAFVGRGWVVGAAWLGFAMSLLAGRLKLGDAADWATGVAFAFLLWSLLNRPPTPVSPRYRNVAESLSGFSYTLYVTHVPLLVLLSAAWFGNGIHLHPTLLGIAKMVATGLVAIAVAIVMWAFFERNTDRVRAWLERRLVPQPVADSRA